MLRRNGSEIQARLYLAVLLSVIAIILMLLDQYGSLRPVQQVISVVFAPIQERMHNLGENLTQLGAFSQSLDQLRKENEDLRAKYEQALSQQGKIAELAQENADLRRQLEFKQNPDSSRFTTVSAQVINRDIPGQNQAIIINRGSSDNLIVGLPVVNPSGYLVGRLSKVEPAKAVVLLITDATIGVNVSTRRFEGNKQLDIPGGAVDGTALGQWQVGGQVKITLIRSDADIKSGDWIFTNGIGGTYPQNLLVGKVDKVIAQDGQPEKQATVIPIVNLNDLQRVQVITSWGDVLPVK